MTRKKPKFILITGPKGGKRVVATLTSKKRLESSLKTIGKLGFKSKKVTMKKALALDNIGQKRGGKLITSKEKGKVISNVRIIPKKRRRR